MRQRIFLGFASILILFLGIGLYAFWLFSRIGGALDVIVSDSHQWVLGGKAMKESAERMDAVSIRNVVPDLQPLVEANDARFVTDTSAELPDVAVDFCQIGHVFSNLVANAARHSMPGEDVVLSAKAIGKSVRFSVLDHGPGIPKEFQGRIFERFFRVPGTEDWTGVGLGLAIAKEMVVSHGGSIGLQSTSGKGSEFYFDLPAISKGAKA